MNWSTPHPDPLAEVAAHTLPAAQVAARLEVDPAQGLTPDQAQARRAVYGLNRLPQELPDPWWRRVGEQLRNPLLGILVLAAVVSAAIGHTIDALVIAAVVVLSVLLGLVQEGRAQKAIAAVQKMLAPKAMVVRAGQRREIDATELVPGDMVWLEAGMVVPADVRLLTARQLAVNESVLTGESLPVEKDPAPLSDPLLPLAERKNCLFSGTLVVRGVATGVVIATGAASELGKIGAMVARTHAVTTPLMRRLEQFARHLSAGIVAATALLFAWAVMGPAGWTAGEAFLASVAIAVAAIPEGLPAMVVIILAVGAQRLAQARALVRRLPAVETLGSATLVASDKTGTLTQNELTVTRLLLPQRDYQVSGVGYAPQGSIRPVGSEGGNTVAWPDEVLRLLEAGVLCNDAELRARADGMFEPVGDPLEVALLTVALKAGVEPESVRQHWRRRDVIPFDAANRWMATLHANAEGEHRLVIKGAFEAVAPRCRDVELLAWKARLNLAASEALRLIAVAERRFAPHEAPTQWQEAMLQDLSLLGVFGLIDPVRPEAVQAVAACHRAGVRVVMVTGDDPVTAAAIARALGLPQTEDPVTGREIETLDDEALLVRLRHCDVVARAAPEQKMRLVQLWQRAGEIVAMTGDGANDAPALQTAHIGIAMGMRGTDAARSAASLVLADDNFATIARALLWGRTAYDNIKKVIAFALVTNLAQALAVAVAMALGWALPISATQILWVNLITTVLLTTALAFEMPEAEVMARPPRAPSEPLLSRPMLVRLVGLAAVASVLTLVAFYGTEPFLGGNAARTFAVNVLVALQVGLLIASRSFVLPSWRLRSGWQPVSFAVVAIVVVQWAMMHLPPLQMALGTTPLPVWSLGVFAAATLLAWGLTEMEKAFWRARGVRAF